MNFQGLGTKALHAGQTPDPTTGARAVPLYQTTSYVFRDTEHAANLFALKELGNIYTRIMNPTTDVFEQRMAALEGGSGALAHASGQAAITDAILNIAGAGDHIVSVSQLYGGTYNLFHYTLPKIGIEVSFVDAQDPDAFRRAVRPNTKAFYGEGLGNPALNIFPFEEVGKIAREVGVPVIVDNTCLTPMLNRPFEWGVNVVVHSSTKYIGGHGTSIGGIVVDGGNFNWGNGRFPGFTTPDPSYHGLVHWEAFKSFPPAGGANVAYIFKMRLQLLRDIGACISPFNSFLMLQGLETLHLRMERICQNALQDSRIPRGAPEGPVGQLSRPQDQPPPRRGEEIPARRLRRPARLRREGRLRGGQEIHRVAPALLAPRQHRRRQVARHPSRQHDAQPAYARGAGLHRRLARLRAPVARNRGFHRHPGRPGASAGQSVRQQVSP